MHSRSGSIENAIVITVILVFCLLPIQIYLIKALTERVHVGITEDMIETSIFGSINYLDVNALGRGKVKYDINKAESEIEDRIKRLINDKIGFDYIGDPNVVISITGNIIDITGEVAVKSFTGEQKRIQCRATYTIELSEEIK